MTPKRHVISHEENWNVNIIGSGPSEPGDSWAMCGAISPPDLCQIRSKTCPIQKTMYISRFRIFFRLLVSRWRELYSRLHATLIPNLVKPLQYLYYET